MSDKLKIAAVGLGSMGYGIASSMLRAGHDVYGFDINEAQVERFKDEGGASGALKDIASDIDALVVVVLNAAQTEQVMFEQDLIVSKMKPGSLVMACATVPPQFARSMEEKCKAHDIHYLDAPISGGSVKAANGQLSIMASGTPEAFTAAEPILEATAETVFKLGDSAGAGSAMKAVNQLLAGVHIAAMAEAITFGMTQGVEPEQFVEVISKCAGTSWMLENRAPHIVEGDYTPHSSINIWPKDLGIVLDIAKASDFDAPISKAAFDQFKAASDMGLGGEDDAAVAKVYASKVNLELPDKLNPKASR